MVKLENWGVVVLSDAFTPPECATYGLGGNAYGHRKFCDGEKITTSAVERVVRDQGDLIVITRNGTAYVLGQVSPAFLDVLVVRGMTLEQALENLS